jgi:hypothetical protein
VDVKWLVHDIVEYRVLTFSTYNIAVVDLYSSGHLFFIILFK